MFSSRHARYHFIPLSTYTQRRRRDGLMTRIMDAMCIPIVVISACYFGGHILAFLMRGGVLR